MKRIIFLWAFILMMAHGMPVFSQAQWHSVNSPVTGDFTSVCFADSLHGWLVTEQGDIVITSDGGMNWQTQSFPDIAFTGVSFPSADHGTLVGHEAMASVTMTSFDGGLSWDSYNALSIDAANEVFYFNDTMAWIAGADSNFNACLATMNGGLDWGKQNMILVTGASFHSIHFRNPLEGQACGNYGLFFTTNNGGSSWAMNISFPGVSLNAIYNFGSQNGVCVGEGGTAFYTINNWYQYISQNTNTINDLNGVWGAPESNKVWAVGDSGTILFMDYYLLGWMQQSSGTEENLNDVYMISETLGWAVGDHGTILKYSIPTRLEEVTPNAGFRVFPNPCTDRVFVSYSLQKKSFVSIELLNMNGQVIKTLVTCFQKPGFHQEVLTHLPNVSEVFFIQFKTDQYLKLQKIVRK